MSLKATMRRRLNRAVGACLRVTPWTARWVPRLKAARLYARYRTHTMIPRLRFLENLLLASQVHAVPGAVVECGVWRGGMSAALAEWLGPARAYYLLDSFEGLPPAAAEDGPAALAWQAAVTSPGYHDNCRAEVLWAEQAMARSGVPHSTCVKGWFADTLPTFTPGPLALLRLDADWYAPTWECLTALFPLVAPGGLILIDDYGTWDGCTRAVHEYLARHDRPEPIHQTAHGVTYLVKRAETRGDGR